MLDYFREVVAVDFEFIATPGNRPVPVCLVAHGGVSAGRRWPSSDYSVRNFNGGVLSASRPFANWKF